MATYNPDMDLFRAQVESLRAQTDTDWICVVNDDRSRPDRFREIAAELDGDDRFVLSRSDRRLGFYRSFERALGLVPTTPRSWRSATRTTAGTPTSWRRSAPSSAAAKLVYSDQRLVDTDGRVLAETYWTSRRNNHTNLLSLLIANTVTGAASLMRREVVERALPFPEVPGEQYHDHWLGLVAMTLGDVAYVDRPLYDYVQHGGAALGHAAANAGIAGHGRLTRAGPPRLLAESLRGRPRTPTSAAMSVSRSSRRRSSPAAPMPARSQARGARGASLAADRSQARNPLAAAAVGLRSLAGRGETLGVERMLAESLLWRHVLEHHSRDWERPIGSPFDASMPPSPGEAVAEAYPDPETAHIERLLTPLDLVGLRREPQRVNLLMPTIDLQHLFGGYIAKFNLARKLAESGHRVRIVTVDPTPPLPDDWREQVEAYAGLAGAMSRIEVAFARDQGAPLADQSR